MRLCYLLVLLSACSSTDLVPLPFPERDANIKSMVVAVYEDELTLSAHEATDPPVIRVSVEEEESILVSVLYYEEPLAAHQLEAGPLMPAHDQCSPYPLPIPAARYDLAATTEEVGTWTSEDGLTTSLANFEFLGKCVCTDFNVRSWDTGSDSPYYALATIDEETALAIPVEPSAPSLLIHRTRIDPIDLGITTGIHSAFRAHDGTIWLGNDEGRLFFGTPSTGFIETTSASPDADLLRVDGTRGDGPFELVFTGLNRSSVEHFDGTTWTSHPWTPAGSDSGHHNGVAWIDQGHAIAAMHNHGSVVELSNGRLREVPWDYTNWAYLRALEYIEGFGVVGVSYHGRFYKLADRSWTPFEGQAVGQGGIRALHPITNGFLYAGNDGVFGTYQEPQGLCPMVTLDLEMDFRSITPLGDAFVLTGRVSDKGTIEGLTSQVVLLMPR